MDRMLLFALLAVLLMAAPAFATETYIPFSGEIKVSSSGWSHITNSFDSPCSGAADMQGTPCYGKVPDMTGEFPVPGPYTLVAFKYVCETYNYDGGCWNGKTCGLNRVVPEADGGSYNLNGDARGIASLADGDIFRAILYKGTFTQKYMCGVCGHGEWVYYVRPTQCKVDIYTKTFSSCDAFCRESDANSIGKEEDGDCQCYCKDGYEPERKELSSGGRDYKTYVCTSKETQPPDDANCKSNSDCKSGEVCLEGECKPDDGIGCKTNSDCKSREICIGGKCRPDDMCTSSRDCNSYCKKEAGKLDMLIPQGICDRQTGECTYGQGHECTAGCTEKFSEDAGEEAVCREECDNRKDDDQDGLVDCADFISCSQSVYCSCKKLFSSSSGRTLSVAVGEIGFANILPSYLERDAEAVRYANTIYNAFVSTSPFNEIGYDFFVTRLPKGAGQADLLARCPKAELSLLLFTEEIPGQSKSWLGSMHAEIFRSNTGKEGPMPNVVMHEVGHAFGGLWDEYKMKDRLNDIIAYISIAKHYFLSRSNCAIVGSMAECQQYFSNISQSFSCNEGCVSDGWYRSSENSIMRDANSQSQFNEVSRALVRKRFDEYFKGR